MRLAGERPYPHSPGHVAHSATSKAAATSVKPVMGHLHAMVLRLLREAGERGLTDAELQEKGAVMALLRPRRCELKKRGLVKASGERRMTPSGRSADVWVCVPPNNPEEIEQYRLWQQEREQQT